LSFSNEHSGIPLNTGPKVWQCQSVIAGCP